MRPEYLESVHLVRWGWSLWITISVPAVLIWGATFLQRRPSFWQRLVVGCAAFGVACSLFWISAVYHSNRIQSAKEQQMRTDAEREDWASDTWNLYAPMSAVLWALLYCTLNQIAASLAWRITQRISSSMSRRPAMEDNNSTNNPERAAGRANDQNPYMPPDSG